jgi:hypothetical protein
MNKTPVAAAGAGHVTTNTLNAKDPYIGKPLLLTGSNLNTVAKIAN